MEWPDLFFHTLKTISLLETTKCVVGEDSLFEIFCHYAKTIMTVDAVLNLLQSLVNYLHRNGVNEKVIAVYS
jgi:hypothetical protein